jgi:replicative DNA helicase
MIFDNANTLFSTALINGVSPSLRDALGIIEAEMLDNPTQGLLLNTIKSMDNFNVSISLMSVDEQLEGKIDFGELAQITKDYAPTRDPMREAMAIINMHNDRLALIDLNEIISKVSSGRPFDREEVSHKLNQLSSILAPQTQSKPRSFHEYAESYINVLESRQNAPQDAYLDIGLDVLIEKISLIVLGGQPGMGKTALALYINDFVAKHGKKTLMFSLEMDGCQLFERQVSAYSKIPTDRLMRIDFGEYDLSDTQWGVIGSSMKGLSDLPIYIDDDPKLTVPLLVKKCKEFKEQHPDLALITIDYLTLMKMPDASRRDLAVGEATRIMKVLAKEIKTPILLLSQLNRDADKALREPRNSDLRDSGSIEQDADVIIFPYREEVHQPDTLNKGLAKIIKSKVRNGKVGNYILGFENGSFKEPFKEWQDEKPQEEQKFERKKF